jgi:hypothetical protein
MDHKNKTLAIISSPFQLLSLGEYIRQYRIDKYEVIILFYKNKELQQMNEINKIYNLKLSIQLKGFALMQYFQLFFLSLKIKECSNLIIGNFFSDPHLFFSNLIKKDKIIVVDDGMIVNSIPDFIGTDKRILKVNRFKKTLIKLLSVNLKYPKKIDLYSIFYLKKHKLISLKKNNLKVLNSQLTIKKHSETLMIIGQPFVEHDMLSLDKYIMIIKRIINDFRNHKLVYFPSRKELPKKLLEIKKIPNLEIIKTKNNIELYLLKNKLLPKKIIGFTSSALITLNTLFNSKDHLIEIKSFKIIFNNTRLPKEVISKMYNTIYNNGIHKHEILTNEFSI